ncbi:MAG: hypothetical protein HY673_23320 [Chloroflexi bacterium]|nr:hypothetical protein [Chloroflexota bacterium]
MLIPSNIVLLSIEAFGGSITGKTLLQKRLYFVSKLIARDMGYRAHYYGPYSDTVAAALVQLKNLGFIEEEVVGLGSTNLTGFEVRRFDYRLSDAGRKAVAWLKANYSDEAASITGASRRLLDAGDLDYVMMSVAAKAHWIFERGADPATPAQIAEEASTFSWTISETEVCDAVGFLKHLNLVNSYPTRGT